MRRDDVYKATVESTAGLPESRVLKGHPKIAQGNALRG